MQRNVALGLLFAVAMATSGCAQAVAGGPIAFESSPAGVSDDALQETGYQLQEDEEYTVERTVDVPVVGERDVTITNHLATYSSAGPEDDAGGDAERSVGAFLVLSTPQAQVAGQGTNPLGRMPLKELVEQVTNRAGDQTDARYVGEREITVLGSETTVEKYSSTTEVEGETVEAFVYVTRVGHGDDYVVGVGILPAQFEDDEDAIYRLMRGLEHDDG